MDPISTLAGLVHKKLTSLVEHPPSSNAIRTVLHVLYTTSMKREESELLRCCVTYLNPETKHGAESPLQDAWNSFPLTSPLPLDTRNLAKISRSADPNAVVIGVYPAKNGQLMIWGLVDQVAVHSRRFAERETVRAESTPGDFHVAVNGVADLTVYRGLGIIAALKQDAVIRKYDEVLTVGPVSSGLRSLSDSFVPNVKKHFNSIPAVVTERALFGHLTDAIARVLLGIQTYKHGGALLITDNLTDSLRPHYGLVYDRLPNALCDSAVHSLRDEHISHYIYGHLLHEKKSIPAAAFREHARADYGSRSCMSQMAGCVKFIASLSRVDGLILMGRDLVVQGFGVEIIGTPEIDTLYRAEDEEGKHLKETNASEYGTRHRSMLRYCNAHQESLGFVVSQDGLVRAIRRVGDSLVMWENVQVISTVNEEECTDATCPYCRVEVDEGCKAADVN